MIYLLIVDNIDTVSMKWTKMDDWWSLIWKKKLVSVPLLLMEMQYSFPDSRDNV